MTTSQRSGFIIDAIHIGCLSSFALAQPIFDLFSRHAEFFVARSSRVVEILLLVVVVSFVIPGLLVLVEALGQIFGSRLRRIIHYFFVASLLFVTTMPPLQATGVLPDPLIILLGGLLAGAGVVLYVSVQPLRKSFAATVLVLPILIFPMLFLLGSRVTKLIVPGDSLIAQRAGVATKTPIIMVVFDEFSTQALLDSQRRIDPIRYPNFSRLSEGATWFRNATTVADFTTVAVPAILTGAYPRLDDFRLPIAADHPENLFSLLASSHEARIFESRTELNAPGGADEEVPRDGMAARLASLISDVGIVYLHTVSPQFIAHRLPGIDQSWGRFGTVIHPTKPPGEVAHEVGSRDEGKALAEWLGALVQTMPLSGLQERDEQFRKFVGSLEASAKPGFYFLHTLLPHVPYDHLPSGTIYTTEPSMLGLQAEHWGDDEYMVRQAHARYLLQVGFVDTLLGELIDRLKALDLYDRSMLIVTADHGVSFSRNGARRAATSTNYCDILPVPLFIKRPFQSTGVVDDRNVETIDIVPTIADVLGIVLPWRADGSSAFAPSTPERQQKVVYSGQSSRKTRLELPPKLDAGCTSLDRQIDRFGSRTPLDRLPHGGPYESVVGRRVQDLAVGPVLDNKILLDNAALYDDVDLDSPFVPLLVTGRFATRIEAKSWLVVSVNGMVQSVTQSIEHGDESTRFQAMIPKSALQKGRNSLQFFALNQVGESLVLAPVRDASNLGYSLVERSEGAGGGEEFLRSARGQLIPIVPHALFGFVDYVGQQADFLEVKGWAAEPESQGHGVAASFEPAVPAASFVIFANERLLYHAPPNAARPDLAKGFGTPELERAGFRYIIPAKGIEATSEAEIRFFAVSQDRAVASELSYPVGYSRRAKFLLEPGVEGSGERLTISGTSVDIVPGAVSGAVGLVKQPDAVLLQGWAIDAVHPAAPERIVVFVNGKMIHADRPNSVRTDLVEKHENTELLWSGFSFRLAKEFVPEPSIDSIRVFAVSKGNVASELQWR